MIKKKKLYHKLYSKNKILLNKNNKINFKRLIKKIKKNKFMI